MRRAPEHRVHTHGVKISARATPTARAVAANGTTNQLRLAHSLPTSSGSVTWWATSGSGSRTAGTLITTAHPQMVRRGWKVVIVPFVWTAAVPGAILRVLAPPFATETLPATTTPSLASGWGGRLPPE